MEIDKVKQIREFIINENSRDNGGGAVKVQTVPDKLTNSEIYKLLGDRQAYTLPIGMSYDNMEIDAIEMTHFPIFGLVGSGGMGRTGYLCYIVQTLLDNITKEPANIRIIDNSQNRLKMFKNNISYYSTSENDIYTVIKEVHEILEKRNNVKENDSLECIIINSRDVYDVINGNDELSAQCVEIMDKFSQRRVCVILSELPNVALKAETAPFMKVLRNNMHVMIFQQLQEQKVIDISKAIENKYQKPLLPGEAYFKMGSYFGKYKVPYFEEKFTLDKTDPSALR